MRNTKLIKDAIATIRDLRQQRTEMIQAFQEISEAIDKLKEQNSTLAQELTLTKRKLLAYSNVIASAEQAYNQLLIENQKLKEKLNGRQSNIIKEAINTLKRLYKRKRRTQSRRTQNYKGNKNELRRY